MNINFLGKNMTLGYTFNSFKYMEDFDITALNSLETNPFKIFGTAEILLMGALNSDRKVIFTEDQAQTYLEEVASDGELFEFVEKLVGLLEESDFFKNLTRDPESK